MTICSIDIETRSDVDIGRGVYNYVASLHFAVLIMCYKIDDGPIRTWTIGQPAPEDLLAHFESDGENHAHNAAFERLCIQEHAKRFGWPNPALETWRCTAVTAAAMSLPRSLDRVGAALGITEAKDKGGKKLIKLFSIPKGPGPLWNEPADHPKEFAEFVDYCRQDVRAEMEVASRLIPLSDSEMEIYHLNERINDRGLRIDTTSARAAIRLAEKAKHKINAELAEVTGGAVTAVTLVGQLKKWCETRGVSLETVGKDDIDDALHEIDDLPDDVRRALELRAEGGKSSVDKIEAMLKRAGDDERARGVYLHHGAGATGRFSSRGCQMHNLPRYRKVFEDAHLNLDTLFEAIRTEDIDFLKMLYGNELGRPLHLLSDSVRSYIWAAPGHELMVADFSSIEGRVAPWLVGQQWKLDAYAALDRGEGHGIYELAATDIYGVDIAAVTKAQRGTGKVAELSCQYQTGAGGISRFARASKIKLASIYPALWDSSDDDRRKSCEERFKERVAKHDATALRLGREGWIAAELIKLGWRAKNTGIVAGWKLMEDAAIAAVQNPGSVQKTCMAAWTVAHDFLWCRLPSGRCLAYGKPEMRETVAPWSDPTETDPTKREMKLSLTVRGVEGVTEQWARFPVYGGMFMNHVTQGTARDILTHGMLNAERAGFPIMLHTHDEAAAEILTGSRRLKEFEDVLCDMPAWAAGLPMRAAGFTGKRYRKQ